MKKALLLSILLFGTTTAFSQRLTTEEAWARLTEAYPQFATRRRVQAVSPTALAQAVGTAENDNATSENDGGTAENSDKTAGQGKKAVSKIGTAPMAQIYAFDTPQGFVLTSARPDGPALLGYSDGANFATASKNEHFQLLMRRYAQQMMPDMHIFKPTDVAEVVEPLFANTWHQYAPFFNDCPTVDGDTCVVGCVALAMGQAMALYQHPRRGEGSFEYVDTAGTGLTLSADFASHTYDWGHVLGDYYQPYNDREAAAVSRLLADCGISVRMRYGTEASGASVVRQPMALATHFGYDRGMQFLFRNFYAQREWDSIMFHEIDAGRPMICGGWSATLAHSFVCDGYDANGFFHLNLGNPHCDANGYYYFTWFTPDQPKSYDVNSPERGVNLLQSLLVGIRPREVSGDSPSRHSFGFSHIEALEDGRVVVHHLANIGWQEHTGRVGLALKRTGEAERTPVGATTLVAQIGHGFELEEVTDTSYTDTLSVTLPQLAEGETRRLVPVFEEDGMMVEARSMVGTPRHLSVIGTAEGLPRCAAATETQARLSVSDVVFADSVQLGTKPQYSLRITNSGAEYSGRFYFIFKPSLSSATQYVFQQQGLSIMPGETVRRDFVRTILAKVPPGRYYLSVCADMDLFTDSLVTLWCDESRRITVLPYSWGTDVASPVCGGVPDAAFTDYDLNGRKARQGSGRHEVVIRQRRDGSAEKVLR